MDWNSTRCNPGCSTLHSTWAAARVAWPHRSTSSVGVNQRMRKPSVSGAKKAVSDRLFSAATACMMASGSQRSNGQTAAGLPPNTRSVNAST